MKADNNLSVWRFLWLCCLEGGVPVLFKVFQRSIKQKTYRSPLYFFSILTNVSVFVLIWNRVIAINCFLILSLSSTSTRRVGGSVCLGTNKIQTEHCTEHWHHITSPTQLSQLSQTFNFSVKIRNDKNSWLFLMLKWRNRWSDLKWFKNDTTDPVNSSAQTTDNWLFASPCCQRYLILGLIVSAAPTLLMCWGRAEQTVSPWFSPRY